MIQKSLAVPRKVPGGSTVALQEFVQEHVLARLFGIGPDTLGRLRREGHLQSNFERKGRKGHLYSMATVDGILNKEGCARNFKGPIPTAAELLALPESEKLRTLEKATKI